MGLNQSSRKITITNDETKLITVSTALAERLKQGATDDKVARPKKLEDAARVVADAVPQPAPQPISAPVVQNKIASAPVPMKTDMSGYYPPEYTLSALQIQQQKEQELQKQDQYWQNRLQNMQRNHALVDQIFEEEHKKAVEEFAKKSGDKDGIRGTITPCLDNSERVLKCYQEHPRETLKCADLVEQFSNCVEQRRAKVIAAR